MRQPSPLVAVVPSVLGVLRTYGANVEEMTNTIFQGAKTAVASIRLSKTPSPEVIAEIAELEEAVIAVETKPL